MRRMTYSMYFYALENQPERKLVTCWCFSLTRNFLGMFFSRDTM